jgi:hypothetical protein
MASPEPPERERRPAGEPAAPQQRPHRRALAGVVRLISIIKLVLMDTPSRRACARPLAGQVLIAGRPRFGTHR